MADPKPALYYALVEGYHRSLPGRIMAVTSESTMTDWNGRRMLYGRDEDRGTTTRCNERQVRYRFKDWAEVEAFEAACEGVRIDIEIEYAKEIRAHNHYRKMMLKFDEAMKRKSEALYTRRRALLEALVAKNEKELIHD